MYNFVACPLLNFHVTKYVVGLERPGLNVMIINQTINQSINQGLSSISQSKESARDASETRISKTIAAHIQSMPVYKVFLTELPDGGSI